MLHVNFGDKKIKTSWGLEFAYWNFSGFPYSVDFCLELEKKKTRIYTELQTGIGIAGVSAGPVLEFNRVDSRTSLGFQTSVWGNYFWGFDFRMRFINDKVFICPGTYLKVPFGGRDENGEKIEGGSGDFDWDD